MYIYFCIEAWGVGFEVWAPACISYEEIIKLKPFWQ